MGRIFSNDLFDEFQVRLAATRNAPAAIAVFDSYMRRIGIDGYDFFRIRRVGNAKAKGARADYLVSTLPESLMEDYTSRGWDQVCPVIGLARGAPEPKLTQDVFSDARPGSTKREMWDAMRDFNIEHELNIPLSDTGHLRQISVFCSGRTAEDATRFANARYAAQVLATQFLWAYEELSLDHVAKTELTLTPREADCLRWIGHGETSPQIAARLGVSSHTVKFHLTNAMRKLDSGSRTQAVAKALRLGLITL